MTSLSLAIWRGRPMDSNLTIETVFKAVYEWAMKTELRCKDGKVKTSVYAFKEFSASPVVYVNLKADVTALMQQYWMSPCFFFVCGDFSGMGHICSVGRSAKRRMEALRSRGRQRGAVRVHTARQAGRARLMAAIRLLSPYADRHRGRWSLAGHHHPAGDDRTHLCEHAHLELSESPSGVCVHRPFSCCGFR